MITNADIKKMKAVFATKEDLKYFATKEDLKSFATKEDIKSFATKQDLKSFATKEDLKSMSNMFGSKFATKDDLINFKDSILSEIIKLREDMEVIIGYRDLIEDHDKRIEKLETTVYQ